MFDFSGLARCREEVAEIWTNEAEINAVSNRLSETFCNAQIHLSVYIYKHFCRHHTNFLSHPHYVPAIHVRLIHNRALTSSFHCFIFTLSVERKLFHLRIRFVLVSGTSSMCHRTAFVKVRTQPNNLHTIIIKIYLLIITVLIFSLDLNNKQYGLSRLITLIALDSN